MKPIQIFATTIVAFLVLLATTETGYGQIVPYKTFGSNAAYSPITCEYGGPGNGTHMGNHDNSGIAEFNPEPVGVNEDGCPIFEWYVDDHRVTAANGDAFSMSGGGLVALCPIDPSDPDTQFFAIWDGLFEVKEGSGTGRFKNVGPAAEPLSIIAVNDPFDFPVTSLDAIWTFSWEFSGEIDLGKKGKK